MTDDGGDLLEVDYDDRVMVMEALAEAKKKYYEIIEKKHGYDGAFYNLRLMVVSRMGMDLKDILEEITWEEK